MRLIQLKHQTEGRKIALVEEPQLRLINNFNSIYDLANKALENEGSLTSLVENNLSGISLEYDAIYHGNSEWKVWHEAICVILPALVLENECH